MTIIMIEQRPKPVTIEETTTTTTDVSFQTQNLSVQLLLFIPQTRLVMTPVVEVNLFCSNSSFRDQDTN